MKSAEAAGAAESGHVIGLLTDYVLDLLAELERTRVKNHLAGCERCRRAALREREVILAVQRTIAAAGRPSVARLRQLRPPAPAMRFARQGTATWQRSLAGAGLMLLIILGSLTLNAAPGRRPFTFSADTVTGTSTDSSDTPTFTATATALSRLPAHSAVEEPASPVTVGTWPAATPAPRATSAVAAVGTANAY